MMCVDAALQFQLQAKELLGFRLGFDNPLVTRIAFQPPPTPPEGFDPAALPPLPASANDPNLKESLKQGNGLCHTSATESHLPHLFRRSRVVHNALLRAAAKPHQQPRASRLS